MWNQYAGGGKTEQAPRTTSTAGVAAGATAWHPTVLYLLALVVVEILVLGFISNRLLK